MIRIALNELAPIPLAAARFAIAAILIVAWLAWTRPPLAVARPMRCAFSCAAWPGIALYNIFLNTGQQTVAAGAASFIVN